MPGAVMAGRALAGSVVARRAAHTWLALACAVLACAVLACMAALCGVATAGPVDAAAARPRQQFVAPAPGSYRLEVIQTMPDGSVLDVDGRTYPLRTYVTGKITLLGFIYTYCVDPVGCPLAFDTFVALRQRLLAVPQLARKVRFVSVSFDPTNDTPQAMKVYGGALADPASALRWHFLTTGSVRELKPMIDAVGQDVAVTLDQRGRATRLFNHLLKIFLIDEQGRVREIYTTAYLLPDVLFNDISTLAMASRDGGRQK